MYALEHEGKGYLPNGGCIPLGLIDENNRKAEHRDLEALRAGVDRAHLYISKLVGPTQSYRWEIKTWMGTVVCSHAMVGGRQYMGFHGSYRRHVCCMIFGRWYQGWYMESSGDYVRLRLAKTNPLRKGDGVEALYGPWRLDGGVQFGIDKGVGA